jgi:alpha-1,2-mannosyltransferase
VIGGTRTLVKAIRTRQVKPALLDFGWLLLGVAIVGIYNVAVVGSDPFLGGYATVDDIQITRPNLGFWVTNLASALADPQRGVLTISPFILYLLLGVRKGWRSAAPWVRDAALGGLAYFLLHNLTHDFRGGDGYFGYRYPLEAVAVSVPLLFCSYQSWVKGHRFRVVVLGISVAVSVLLQAYGLANQFG